MSLVPGMTGHFIRLLQLFGSLFVLVNSQDFTKCSGTLVINNTNYEDSLSKCTSWDGSFTVNLYPNSYTFNSIASLTQDLKITCNVDAPGASASTQTTLSMPKLETIDGAITLEGCPNTFKLDLPALKNFTDLTLNEVGDITDQLNSPTSRVYDAMSGSLVINLCNLTSVVRTAGGSIGNINAQMNDYLTNISMNSIHSMTGSLTIENCPGVSLNFANLSSVSSGTLRQIGSINMPVLTNVNGDFQFDSNDVLGELVLPSLKAVGNRNGGDFMITNNMNLTNIDVKQLGRVEGSLTVSNDGALGDLSSLGRVQSVGKDLTLLNSPIYAVNLGNLSSVGGQFELSTTYSDLKCENFTQFNQKISLNRPLLCGNYTKIEDISNTGTGSNGNNPSATDKNGSPTSSSTSTSSSDHNKTSAPSAGTMAGIVLSTILALILASLISVLLWRHRQKQKRKRALQQENEQPTAQSRRYPLLELKEDTMKPELSNDGQRHEMSSAAQHQLYEMPNESEVFEMPAEPVQTTSVLGGRP